MIKILFVGNLTKSKGFIDLLLTYDRICNKYHDVNLIVVGDGYLQNRINNKKIIYLGKKNQEDLARIYKDADIFVSPSKDMKFLGVKIWEEYFSYTLMEAQASGLPIVATDCGGVKEEIDSINYLIRQGDVNALYNALSELIDNPRLRKKIGAINRLNAEKFYNSKKQSKLTEEVIYKFLLNA